jgi:hypothetical protein
VLAGVALLLTSVAVPTASAAGKKAGIAKARAAGIAVDPAVTRIMARAPHGTCLNNPALAKCPAIKAVVLSNTEEMPDGSLAYGPSLGAANATAAKLGPVARAAQVPQCFLKADYPYYSGGWAWGQGVNTCTAAASSQALYVWLKRTTDGVWVQLDVRYAEKAGGGTIRRTAGYNCGHSNQRHYKTQSDGYSVVGGTMWAATQSKTEWLTC